jgi:hypothetical protein
VKGTQLYLKYIEREGAGLEAGAGVLYGVTSAHPGVREADDVPVPARHDVVEHASESAGAIGQPTARERQEASATWSTADELRSESREATQEEQCGVVAAMGERTTAEGTTALHEAILEPLPGERHQFRIVISPDDAEQLDLTKFTQRVMQQVECDIGQPLIWAAANHYDTDDYHVHLVLRGVDRNGAEVRFDRAYISRVWRERAQELATRELGLRTEFEYQRQLRREINRGRLTSLDRAIGKRAVGGVVRPRQLDKFQRERLRVLGEMGLAHQVNHLQWRLDDGWQQKLREDGERGDIIKQMHKAVRVDTGRFRIVRRFEALPYEPTEGKEVTGRVARLGLIDRSPGAMYAILETTRGGAYYVPLWRSEVGVLRQGDLVTLRDLRDSWSKPLDEPLHMLVAAGPGLLNESQVRGAVERRLAELEGAGAAVRGRGDTWILASDFRERVAPSVAGVVHDGEPHSKALDALLEWARDGDGRVELAAMSEAVARRLRELEELGLAPRIADGHRLRQDFLAVLERLDLEKPRAHVGLRRHKLSLEGQVTYVGPTWLDQVETAGSSSFVAEVSALRARRQRFLAERGFERKGLVQREREDIAERLAKRLGRKASSRAAGFRGVVTELHEAPSGNRYAIIANDAQVIAVRAGQKVRKFIGQEVRVSFAISEYDGKSKLNIEPAVIRPRAQRER